MSVIAFDSETRLIEAGNLAPQAACFTFCRETFVPTIYHASEAHDILKRVLQEASPLVGANTCYDTAVICSNYPDLLPLVFNAYRDGRVRDIQLDQRLIDLAYGRLDGYYDASGVYVKFSYSLAALHERYGLGALAKGEDTWRLRYGELIPVPMHAWPAEAKEYALNDALATLKVHLAQQAHAEFIGDGIAQARKAFALHLQSCRGMVTDPRACDEFLDETKEEIARCQKLLEEHKILRDASFGKRAGSKDTKAAQARMVQVCRELDIEPKLTAGGGISLDAEACRDTGDEILQAYAAFTSSKTAFDRCETLKKASGGIPLQTAYTYLVSNGRTASRIPSAPLIGMNLQNLPSGGKMRECIIARPGFVLNSVDYTGCELHTFAQCELWLTGKSFLGDALNEGKDAHCMVAATLLGEPYEVCVANKKHGKYYRARQLGKIANFGFSGGMGAKKLMLQTNKKAKNASERVTLEQCLELREAWLNTWQTREYFNEIQEMTRDGITAIKQFVSGRTRGGCDYMTAANGFFSGLAADGMTLALWRLADECYAQKSSPLYGSYPLLCVHDEVILEIPEASMHEAAMRHRDVMVEAMNEFVPDYPVRAEPAVMRFWSKEAEAVYDENGRLVLWTRKPPSAT